MLDELFASDTPFDWDQFLVGDVDQAGDASAAPADADTSPASAVLTPSNAGSPASDVNGASPKSTESESSQSLEVSKGLNLFDFDFDLPAATGIAHDPSDIMATLAPSTAAALTTDPTLPSDPTVLSTFGSSFANFGSLASLGSNAVSQLQLGNLLSQLTGSAPAQPAPAAVPSLPEAYAALGWPLTTESKAATASPAPSMKRKLSEMSDDQSAKRSRGRVGSSGATPIAKRPYRRQSKNGLSLSQLAAAAASGSPVVVPAPIKVETPAPADEDDDEEPVKLTASGKLSTARPKAVVPEKYMKNGEAQAITGMSTEDIMAFPNWAALMACVDDAHRAGAEVFGKMITENRDKAKWAAKKSRDERKAKVESLEGQVDELQSQIADLRGLLLGLVGRGLVPLSEVESYI